MLIVNYRKILYAFSFVILAISIFGIVVFGFRLGVDFSGGSIMEVEFLRERPSLSVIEERLTVAGISSFRIQPTDERGLIIRFGGVSDESKQTLLSALYDSSADTPAEGDPSRVLVVNRFDSIGPSVGAELRKNALISIFLVIILILIFVSWAFRRVSRPVSSWKYGAVAIVALVHDIIVPAGLFAYLGKFYGAEVDTLFVTALLTILGFSVHDTIVVFDRIRENLLKSGGADSSHREPGEFEKVVGKSLNETYGRSLATSLALFLVLISLFWFGAETTRHFTLTLLVGIVAGTYSSICLASTLLITWHYRFGTK